MNRLSEEMVVSFPFTEKDIGGGNTAGSDNTVQWLDMADFDIALFRAELGTWHATDDLDTAKIQQATSSAGAGIKDLTTSESGGDYDTDAPIDADGDSVTFDIRAEDLDAANGFRYVRFYAAEVTGTGTDNISCTAIRATARYAKEELTAAAVAGEIVYVTKG